MLGDVARQAADAGTELAFETRSGTLTDAPASTEFLLAEVDRPNVLAYWQPPVAASEVSARARVVARDGGSAH